MSKLPNHTLWARATTSATSSSSRATSMLPKSHAHGSAGQSRRHRQSMSSVSSGGIVQQTSFANVQTQAPDHAALAALGAVSAPFYGPQPAAVIEAYEHHQALVTQHDAAFSPPLAGTSSSLASSISFAPLASLSQSIMLSAPALRNIVPPSVIATRSQRPLHVWTQAQGGQACDTTLSNRVLNQSMSRRQAKPRLLFDVSDTTRPSPDVKGKGVAQSTGEVDAQQVEKLEELLASLWATHYYQMSGPNRQIPLPLPEKTQIEGERRYSAPPGAPFSFTSTNPFLRETSGPVDESSSQTSPSQSRSPSPGPSREGAPNDVGHRSPFGHVNEPPAKFAVTTSAESSLSSSSTGDSSGGNAAKLQYIASTSSASAPTGSASSLPPQASAPAGTTDHWARTFNIPRSSKRHDYMFEHGAYGIPKRHPLSSIRDAMAAPADSGERTAPSRDVVPSGKVRAATDMLSAAADFLVGPQGGRMASSEFRPSKGRDALQAALAGGSTAEGHELRQPFRSTRGKAGKEARPGVHRMAIRGPDGRIIKERLRSVQVGEDAYFLRPDALGVADGVGGWASRPGADPALFSRLLMHFCAVELSRYDGLSASELAADNGSLLKAWASVDPVEVMHRAWERCVRASRREGILGSSTALIGLLRGDELRIANMGDCVLMIIRGGEMMFRSTEQQHSFNFPVQLGMMGDTTDTIKKHVMASLPRERAAGEGEVASGALEDYDDVEDDVNGSATKHAANNTSNGRNGTTPPVKPAREDNDELEPDWDEPRRDAGRWTVRVEAGDIIVVGSDGLMDNLFDEDIIEEVLRFLPSNPSADGLSKIDSTSFSPQLVSEALCSRAKAVSEDSRAISSPFQQRAMEEGLNYVGGKHDDISVLVCLVGERDTVDPDSDGESSDGSEAATPNGTNGTTSKFFIR